MKDKDSHWVCPACRHKGFTCGCPLEAIGILHKKIEKMPFPMDAVSVQESRAVLASMDLLSLLAVDHSNRVMEPVPDKPDPLAEVVRYDPLEEAMRTAASEGDSQAQKGKKKNKNKNKKG